jgi:hypothetical protein
MTRTKQKKMTCTVQYPISALVLSMRPRPKDADPADRQRADGDGQRPYCQPARYGWGGEDACGEGQLRDAVGALQGSVVDVRYVAEAGLADAYDQAMQQIVAEHPNLKDLYNGVFRYLENG